MTEVLSVSVEETLIVGDPTVDTITVETVETLSILDDSLQLIEVAEQGPPGPPGAGEGELVAVRTVTADTTLTSADGLLRIDATAGPVRATLPAAADVPLRVFYIKRLDATANTVTVFVTGAEYINVDATVELDGQDSVLGLSSDEVDGYDVLSSLGEFAPDEPGAAANFSSWLHSGELALVGL